MKAYLYLISMMLVFLIHGCSSEERAVTPSEKDVLDLKKTQLLYYLEQYRGYRFSLFGHTSPEISYGKMRSFFINSRKDLHLLDSELNSDDSMKRWTTAILFKDFGTLKCLDCLINRLKIETDEKVIEHLRSSIKILEFKLGIGEDKAEDSEDESGIKAWD